MSGHVVFYVDNRGIFHAEIDYAVDNFDIPVYRVA